MAKSGVPMKTRRSANHASTFFFAALLIRRPHDRSLRTPELQRAPRTAIARKKQKHFPMSKGLIWLGRNKNTSRCPRA
jgi:hypothetical protein